MMLKDDKIVDLRRRLIAEVLSVALMFGVTGCARLDAKTASERNGISNSVEEYDNLVSTGLKYILDFEGFENSEIEIPETTSGKVVGNVYSSKVFKNPSSNLHIEWPSCFAAYLSENTKEEMYTKFDITCVEDNLIADNNNIRVVYSKLVAKEDLKAPTQLLPYDVPQETIHKGDTMESEAVYLEIDGIYYLVGYTQTGVGSDCANVINKMVGDLNLGLVPIDSEANHIGDVTPSK